MIKTLIYSHSQDANAGGGLAYTFSVAKGLLGLGHHVTIRLHGGFPVAGLAERYKIKGLRIDTDVKFDSISIVAQLKLAMAERKHFDRVIYHTNTPPKLNLIRKSFLLCDFPALKRLNLKDRIKLKTWSSIIVNSEFTAAHTEAFWGRKSGVLNPPINRSGDMSHSKNGHFLSIGRFIRAGRSKRQDVIIEAYKQASKKQVLPPLHLAGFVQDRKYVKALENAAKGHEIYFHKNIDRKTIEGLLTDCSTYIHACGLDVDENNNPEMTEHYGITVLEAMAHGCVPLVVPKGGPKAIVDDGVNGMYWSSAGELATILNQLEEKKVEYDQMRNAAYKKSKQYGIEAFKAKLKKIIK